MSNYNKDYYENGIELGISGYKDYRWLPHLTIPMCESIVNKLSINKDDSVLDYGCAKGFIVKAFHHLGIKKTFGVDISEYAIKNCDAEVVDYLKLIDSTKNLTEQITKRYDWIICKDVLEHVEKQDLKKILIDFREMSKNVFIVVPLGINGKYIIEEYENDITHVIREDLEWWENQIKIAGFEISDKSYNFKGVKDNWSSFENGNAFIVGK